MCNWFNFHFGLLGWYVTLRNERKQHPKTRYFTMTMKVMMNVSKVYRTATTYGTIRRRYTSVEEKMCKYYVWMFTFRIWGSDRKVSTATAHLKIAYIYRDLCLKLYLYPFFSLLSFLKGKSKLMISCLSAPTYQHLNQLVDFYEIQ
jgi:hypothetical protein